jgi:transposase
LSQLPSGAVLRTVWQQQYTSSQGQLRLRTAEELPRAGERINTPYDPQAGFGTKAGLSWSGYKVHLTESCDVGQVHLITHVETTQAQVPDNQMTAPIQQALTDQGLAPGQHLVDAGYIDAELMATSQGAYGIDLVGPVAQDRSWQATAGQGFDLTAFHIDWDHQQATCPQGHVSRTWQPRQDAYHNPVILVKFASQDCKECPMHDLCTHSTASPRYITLRPQGDLREARGH